MFKNIFLLTLISITQIISAAIPVVPVPPPPSCVFGQWTARTATLTLEGGISQQIQFNPALPPQPMLYMLDGGIARVNITIWSSTSHFVDLVFDRHVFPLDDDGFEGMPSEAEADWLYYDVRSGGSISILTSNTILKVHQPRRKTPLIIGTNTATLGLYSASVHFVYTLPGSGKLYKGVLSLDGLTPLCTQQSIALKQLTPSNLSGSTVNNTLSNIPAKSTDILIQQIADYTNGPLKKTLFHWTGNSLFGNLWLIDIWTQSNYLNEPLNSYTANPYLSYFSVLHGTLYNYVQEKIYVVERDCQVVYAPSLLIYLKCSVKSNDRVLSSLDEEEEHRENQKNNVEGHHHHNRFEDQYEWIIIGKGTLMV